LANLDEETVRHLIEKNKLSSKQENGQTLIEASTGARALVVQEKDDGALSVINNQNNTLSSDFVEKTIGTILNLHEKVLDSKDETVEVLKRENEFLKEALYSMQDLYEEDRKTIETLTKQLEKANNEVEFTKRKYKIMWNKTIEKMSENA
jgi:predicted RNase H-like nuclease (RuvC/YqgF family)